MNSSHISPPGTGAALLGMISNFVLAGIKITAGILGNSYALIADGVESTVDVLSSFAVWHGLRIASQPPDLEHPYGHGKAESIAGIVTALTLVGASIVIAVESIKEISTPHHAPAPFTLVVLLLVIFVKLSLSRFVGKTATELDSVALKGDAAHHVSDALTSAAAFIGISIALIGGAGYESADDWGALFASGVIAYNGVALFRPALHEIMDGTVRREILDQVKQLAGNVSGVYGIEKCRVRKSGLGLWMDIHVEVDGTLSVDEGHRIGAQVKYTLLNSPLRVLDVVVHIEPANR